MWRLAGLPCFDKSAMIMAANAQSTPMNFQDPSAPGGLMQAVNILGDYSHPGIRQQAFEFRDLIVSGIGTYIGDKRPH